MQARVRALATSLAAHAPLDARRLLLAAGLILVLFAAYRFGRNLLMALMIVATLVAVRGIDGERADEDLQRATYDAPEVITV